jgi:hypothetical protein
MSKRGQALLAGIAGFLVAFVVVYVVANVIIGLVVVLAALAAAGGVGVAAYNYVLGRPLRELPWRRRR